MRSFETRGPVYPEDNYVVARTDELSDFINRLEKGRYVVLFAPRQTGKTTFFHRVLETLPTETYFPIQIDFQASNNLEPSEFYEGLYEDIREEIAESTSLSSITRESTSLKPKYGAGLCAMRQARRNSQDMLNLRQPQQGTTSCLITVKSQNLA